MDASEAIYDRNIARVREQFKPRYEALAALPEDERGWWEVELQVKGQMAREPAMSAWQLRDIRIIEWCERNGYA